MEERIVVSDAYRARIRSMHDTKVKLNKEKLAAYGGSIDIDDHGFIYFDGFTFQPDYPDESGVLYGCRAIGQNLRRFLNEIPVYIHPDSALTGAWAGVFQNFANIGLRPEDRPVQFAELHKKYGITQSGIGGMNHLGPDMTIGFRDGLPGLLEKVRWYRQFNAPADTDFYDGEEAVVLGMMEYTARHRDYARELAEKETDPFRRANYEKMADVNDALLNRPPRTFREACQFLAIFQSVDRTYYAGGALGQLDELLRPFYEKDVKDGVLTDEEAVWMIASLFYNDTHYSQIGGQLPDGSRGLTSHVSFLILEAAHLLHIPYNLAVRVYEDESCDPLLRRAVEYILEDGSGPSFSLSEGIETGYTRQGHPRELARMRAKVGCNWVALPGIEYPLQDVTRLNLAWAFLYALDEVMESGNPNLDDLWTHFLAHMKIMVNCIKDGYDWHYEVVSRNTPEVVLNLFCHGPIERGVNSASGGVDIINLNVDGIALATVADSFAAIEQRVVREKKLTWQEMYEAVKSNFEGKENIRLMLKNIPRFGNPDSLANNWALKIRDSYVAEVLSSKTPKHHLTVIPGMFSHGDVFAYGKRLPATPNGRKYGDPISHSAEPDPGFAQGLVSFSPTLKANAVASVQPGMGNSAPLHLDIDVDMLQRAGGADTLCTLIHVHNQMGGTLLNLNCVTKEQIRQAHADPDSQPDLVVRVTGYSAFFASLSKEYRQQVVDRYLSDEK